MYPLAAGKHVPCKHGQLLHRESASTKLCLSLTMNVPEKNLLKCRFCNENNFQRAKEFFLYILWPVFSTD